MSESSIGRAPKTEVHRTMLSTRVILDGFRVEQPPFSARAGGTVRFSQFGGESSRVTPNEQPAELVFFLGLMSKARDGVGTLEEVARYKGTIVEVDGCAVFVSADNAVLEASGTPSSGDGPPQQLLVHFSAGSFENTAAEALVLDVPVQRSFHRYGEIGVVLEVNGGVEAPLHKNDRLDFRVDLAGPPFEVEVLGDDGMPLVGVNVLVSQCGHIVLSGPTDETGKVTVAGHGQQAPCLVEIEGMAPMIIEGGLVEGDCPLEYEPGEIPAPVEGCDAANAETCFAELEAPPDDLFA